MTCRSDAVCCSIEQYDTTQDHHVESPVAGQDRQSLRGEALTFIAVANHEIRV